MHLIWYGVCESVSTLRNWILTIGLFALGACSSPLGPIAGGTLEGETVPWPKDWTFTDRIENVLLQTNPSDPYSVTIWGVQTQGSFYIAAVSSESRWVQNIAKNNAVVLGIKHELYDAYAILMERQDLPPDVLQAYINKYDIDPDGSSFFESGGVVFELVER
ncbi:MAG: hypothetical protein AAF541_11180 [Pseudomonadota bacterium]